MDWSPKGGRLVVTCWWGWGTNHLLLMNTGGKVRSLLTSEPATGTGWPEWSPDGKRIVFAEFWPNWTEISLIDASDGSLVRLTDTKASNHGPAWSPDGRRIAFVVGYGAIWVMNADGSQPRMLVRSAGSPAWQPVGAP